MSNIDSVTKEFKAFILKGNIIDIVVGVIIDGAFGKIITSLVNGVLMSLLGAPTGGTSFNILKYVTHPTAVVNRVKVVKAAILYGSFLQNTLDFPITDMCTFFMTKTVAVISSRLRHEEEAKEEAPASASPTQEKLLARIRDPLEERGDIA